MIIWGNKGYQNTIGFILKTCQSCAQHTVFSVIQAGKKFTLYFIPTFSYSSKHYIICHSFGESFLVPKEMKSDLEEVMMSEEELMELAKKFQADVENQKENQAEKNLIDKHNCFSCGQEVGSEQNFCASCGQKQRKTCKYCAEKIRVEDKFCRYCGKET